MATTPHEPIKALVPASRASTRLAAARGEESRFSVLPEKKQFIVINATSVRTYKPGELDVIVLDKVAGDTKGFHKIVDVYATSTPEQRMRAERRGVAPKLIKGMAKVLKISNVRFYQVLGIPKATAEKKASTDAPIAGAAGQSALGVIRLLGIANRIVANSDAAAAKEFDTAKWLGQWLERPQPALGGRKPADILDTPTGIDTVAKLLGAIESGAYL